MNFSGSDLCYVYKGMSVRCFGSLAGNYWLSKLLFSTVREIHSDKTLFSVAKKIIFEHTSTTMADLNTEVVVNPDADRSETIDVASSSDAVKVELTEEEKTLGLVPKSENSKETKFKIHTTERNIAEKNYSCDDMIQVSVLMYSDFLTSQKKEAAIVSVQKDSKTEVEKTHVQVQCSENWVDSMFVYDLPQLEALVDGEDTANKIDVADDSSAAIDGDPQEAKVCDKDGATCMQPVCDKRKATEDPENKELKRAKLETKALKAKRPGFTDERYNETSYYIENGLRKVYPYYFTFTTFTKGRWVGEKILDVFAREFRAHPAEEYERCIRSGSLTVNYERVDVDYKLKHNDLLANVVHRHEVPVTADPISIVHMDEDVVVVNKPASIPVHPCGRYRHNTVVFILAKEYNLKNLRTIHRLDRLTSGLLMFGRTPKKARTMEQQIRNRQVQKEYVCRVEGQFPSETIECDQPIEVVSYKIGVCKVSEKGKTCSTTFKLLGYHAPTNTSVVLCLPHSGRMHQIRVHLQFLGYPVVNDPLYNHEVFGPLKGRGGLIGKTDTELVRDLIRIHNAENWLGVDADLSMLDEDLGSPNNKCMSREPSPCEVTPSSPPRLSSSSISLYSNNNNNICSISKKKVTVATQTGHEAPDLSFDPEKLTSDPHCYECKVRYRDPKPQDLVMFLHAWKYRGPGWSYQTELPDWARIDWTECVD